MQKKKTGEFVHHMLDITENGDRIQEEPIFSSQDVLDRLELYHKSDDMNEKLND